MSTGSALVNYHGMLIEQESYAVDELHHKVIIRGASILLDGQVEQLFQRYLSDYTQQHHCRQWQLNDYRSGIENTFFGARRYAEGIIRCQS